MHIMRLAALVLAGVVAGAAAQAQTISIGTSPVGSLNHSLGNALGKVVTEVAGLRVRVVPYGGGQQFLPLIDKKELEMAVPSATDALFAFQGKGDFAGNPSPGLRIIGTVFPYYIGWFVKKDSPYRSLSDLKGKKLAIGFTANSAQRRTHLGGLATEGLTEADFDGVPVPHVVRGADDFMQGKVDATTFAVGAGKVAEADIKVGGIRYLNLSDSADAQARLKQILPASYVAAIQPAPELTGIVGPTKVLHEDYLILTGAQLADDDAYKVAKVLYDAQDKLATIAKVYARYDKNELTRDRGIPFHPGAIRFYREKGIWSPKS
jgi:TRAP transporter TAXI family solute receptor